MASPASSMTVKQQVRTWPTTLAPLLARDNLKKQLKKMHGDICVSLSHRYRLPKTPQLTYSRSAVFLDTQWRFPHDRMRPLTFIPRFPYGLTTYVGIGLSDGCRPKILRACCRFFPCGAYIPTHTVMMIVGLFRLATSCIPRKRTPAFVTQM
jgi:hypothetical protein